MLHLYQKCSRRTKHFNKQQHHHGLRLQLPVLPHFQQQTSQCKICEPHSPPLLSFLITQDKRGAIWSLELVWRMWVCSYCCQNCVPNTWCMGLRILLTCSIVPLQFFHIRSFVSFPSGSIWILSSSELAGLWWGGGDDGSLSKLCELIAKSFLR